MTAWDWLKDLHTVCHFQSRERTGEASNSELKRWIQNKALKINAETVEWNEELDFPLISVILFPRKPIHL